MASASGNDRLTPKRGVAAVLQATRYLVVIGSITSLILAGAAFLWAVSKAAVFLRGLITSSASDDASPLKL